MQYFFLKHPEVWTLIKSRIFKRNFRTAVIISILSWFVLHLSASPLYAQDDRVFFIEWPKLELGGYYRLVDEERQTPNLKTKNTNQKFRESIYFETNGWIYHPNLMDFHLAVEPELQQETFRQNQVLTEQTRSYYGDTSLLAFDVGATFLKHKPVSLNIFANRKTGQIDLTDAQDSDITSETLGSRLNFNNPTLPVSIAVIHHKLDQTGFYLSYEDRNEVDVSIQHNAHKSVTRLNMLYNNSETTRTTFEATDISSRTTSTELTNAYSIKDDNRVRIDSQIYNMRADYNGLDQNTWIVSENLFWSHSKNLLTRYRADYNRNEFGDIVNEETRLSAALTHHYMDRLTTDAGVAAAINKFDGGSEDLYKSNIDLLYYHPIPWGSLQLGAAYDFDVTNRSGTQNIVPAQERLTFSTGTETLLSKESVDPGSIVVTDITGVTVYTENIDYIVDIVGPDVSISRTLMGAIEDGQQVNVHYSYQINTPYDDSRFGQKYQLSLAMWSFLHLAYSLSRIDQDILSGESPNDPLGDTSHTVRLGFDIKWSDTEFLYNQQDRTNSNSSTTRSVTQRINFRPGRNYSVSLTGNVGDRDFTDLYETEKFYSFGSRIVWTPRSWCNLSLSYVRNKISSDRRDELNTEFVTTARLIYGLWTGSISYRLRDQDEKQNGNSLWRQEAIIKLTRRFR